MSCFSLQWVEQALIWLVVVGAVVAIIRLFLPPIMANFGPAGATLMQVLNIILWAVVIIAVIIFAFELLSCLIGGGLRLPRV
jgi:hypothetical protein